MNYVWDPKKNRRNIAQHGIAFEDAVRIFEGSTLEKVDDRFEYGEVRVYAIGIAANNFGDRAFSGDMVLRSGHGECSSLLKWHQSR
jgi:uncharacterized DUF497 family protein